jgi:hypothetical protein
MADVTQNIDVRIKTAIDSANAENSLKSLRGALKDLQSLAEEAADSNTGAFEELEVAINRVEGRIGDASDRLRVMAGEPLERVRNGVGLIGEGIKNLDFTKATIGIDGLASGIKGMNVGDFKKGIESVTGSFINLGKALISNPIFLLATVVTALIANFDKLAAAGGIVGKIFSTLGNIIETVKQFFIDLSDALGITGIRVSEIADKTTKAAQATKEWKDEMIDLNKQLAQAQNLATFIFDFKKSTGEAAASVTTLNEEIKKLKNDNKRGSEELVTLFDEVKNYATNINKEVVDANGNLLDATQIVDKQSKTVEKFVDKLLDITIKYNNLTSEDIEKYSKMMGDMVTKRYQQEVTLQVAKLNQTKDLKLKELDVERQTVSAIINEQERSKKLADIDAREKRLRSEYEAKTRISLSKQIFEAENYTNKEISTSDELRFRKLQFLYENRKKFEEEFNIMSGKYGAAEKERTENYIKNYESLFGKLPYVINKEVYKQIDESLTKSKTQYDDYLKQRADTTKNAAVTESKDIIKAQQLAAGEAVAIDKQKYATISKIDYDNAMELLSDEKSRLKERYELYQSFNDKQRAAGKKSYEKYEADKLSNTLVYLDEEYKLNKVQIDLVRQYKQQQLDEATDPKVREKLTKEIKRLGQDLEDLQTDYTITTETMMTQSSERVGRHIEEIRAKQQAIALEYIAIQKAIQEADIQSSQNLININQIEMDLLDTKANKYRNVEEEKKTLIMENFANQGILLQQQMAAELLANEQNTINKEQRAFEIKELYAEKEKQLRKDTSEAIIGITQEELDRKAQMAKSYVDMAVNLDSFVRDITRIGLSETKKEEEKSARQRFVVQKIAGILSVGIDTAVGVMKANAASPLTGGMPFTAFIIAQGAAAAAAIAARQFSYSGGGSDGGGGSISATSPNVGTPPTLNTSSMFNPSAFYGVGTQRTESSTGRKEAQRVYVVESDITSVQTRVEVQAQRATLSGL